MMAMQKKKQPQQSHDSALEQFRDLGGGVTQSLQRDVVGGLASDVLNNIFSPVRSDVNPQEQILLQNQEIIPPQPARSEFRKPEVILFTAQEANLSREVEAVRSELKKAVLELKELNSAVLEVEKAVLSAPVKAGTYHASFFARLRTIIKLFRQQVSESRVWLEASFAKKRKKGYWSMFKKHGTSFAMSSERALASQAG